MLDIDLAGHEPGFRPFLVRSEAWAYWTVYDGGYEPVDVADVYLRRVRFGSGMALVARGRVRRARTAPACPLA